MDKEMRDKLTEIIQKDLVEINEMSPDSESRKQATENVEKLIQLVISDFEAEAKASKDDELVKIEKKKGMLDFLAKVAGVGVTAAGIVASIWADRNGWFVSKAGLSMVPKPKI